MSNRGLIIEERSRDIGDFLVGRLLPFARKRMVGPFIFVDHMGPATLGPDKYVDVDQHPHVGLCTLTYLLEGEIMHQDSIGTVQRIKPGGVNLMVAGKGITHTERTPEDMRQGTWTMHGYQIWIALPKDKEMMEPEFYHVGSEEVPEWKEGGVTYRLLIGEAFKRKAQLPVYSSMFMFELLSSEEYTLNLSNQVKGEVAIIVTKGSVKACDNLIESGNMLVAKEEEMTDIKVSAGSRLIVLGGESFPEKRYIDWNFVSSSKLRLNEAIEDWKQKGFPKIIGDDTYIPYPGA